MKNWKKIMAMLCTAAMVTGFSAPVWAEADAAEDTETADDEITELTMDMLDEAAYEGTWLSFEPGFDLYVPSNWDVLEISDEDAADGVMFQAQDPDSEEGVNMEQSMICIPWLMSWLQSMKMLRRFALTDSMRFPSRLKVHTESLSWRMLRE